VAADRRRVRRGAVRDRPITAGHTAIRRIAAARASLDAEVMDEVEGNVQRRRNARVMATTDEQSTLDEETRARAVRRATGRFPGQPGMPCGEAELSLQRWSSGSRTATPAPELSEAGVALLSDRYPDTREMASGAPPAGPPAPNCPAHHRRCFALGSTAYPQVLEDPQGRAWLLRAPASMLRPAPPRTYPACSWLSHLLRYHDAGPTHRSSDNERSWLYVT
jgi:hypothetical protein